MPEFSYVTFLTVNGRILILLICLFAAQVSICSALLSKITTIFFLQIGHFFVSSGPLHSTGQPLIRNRHVGPGALLTMTALCSHFLHQQFRAVHTGLHRRSSAAM
jgi:hypothetical protein